jgi:hypothetical protein
MYQHRGYVYNYQSTCLCHCVLAMAERYSKALFNLNLLTGV